MNLIDLRKYNVKNLDDAVQFLDLFESKVPQIKSVIKKQKLEVASLNNRLSAARAQQQQVAQNPNASVLDVVTGKDKVETPDQEKSRIEQLRAAVGGEIGQLKVEDVDAKPAEEKPAPELPEGGETYDPKAKNESVASTVIKKKNGKK